MQAFTIGSTALTRPGQLPQAVAIARNRVLTALNQPLGAPTLPTGATTPLRRAAVRAIEIGSAVAFQAPELLLLGAAQAANTAATTLSRTGNIPAAIAATGASIASTVTAASTAIRSAVTAPVPATQGVVRNTNGAAARQVSSSVDVKVNVKPGRITKPVSRFGHQATSGTAQSGAR